MQLRTDRRYHQWHSFPPNGLPQSERDIVVALYDQWHQYQAVFNVLWSQGLKSQLQLLHLLLQHMLVRRPLSAGCFFCCSLCYFILNSSSTLAEVEVAPLSTDHPKAPKVGYYDRPIEIAGMDFPLLVGKQYTEWSLVTFDGEEILPIPFQIDEYNEEGFPYFEEAGIPRAGEADILNDFDRILFMLSDAMPNRFRPSAEDNLDFELLEEIRIRLQDEDRFVYLVANYKNQSEERYVRYEESEALIRTDFYSLRANPDNFLDWQNFRYYNFRDEQKESLLDSLKFRISGAILADSTKITLSNKNLRAEQTSVKGGAIRLMVMLKTVVHIAKIPVMSLQVQVHFYPKSVVSHSRTNTPGLISYLFADPSVRISLDGNDLRGGRFYSSEGYNGHVDGTLSRQELNIQNLTVSPTNNWMLLAHPDNFLLLTEIEMSANANSPVSLVYEDDLHLRDKPERFLGQLPNMGYIIKDLPVDELFYMSFSMYFDDRAPEFDPTAYIARFKQPFEVQSITLH